ncbi:MAG: gyrase subunit [Planctomycetota bacterium]|jgi:DNA gyrase subunit A
MADGAPTNQPDPGSPKGGAAEGAADGIVDGIVDRVIDLDIDRELHESYLTYAMSTIMDRALPDVRDGLKPSQRRILVAMNDLRLSPGRKQIKCAKICGDTSGNYHPHGESVIYPTLVNMGQDWKARYMFVDKQGNFGSIEGDPPAAMRYTEARMTHAAMAMMEDLDKETVDFKANYDERLMEPCVLPGKFPNLLVNGSSGIAVGMSSTMPPHNLREICGAIVATIDDPLIGVERLMELVPGPDFPTGGIIMGRRGIMEAYAAGRGRIVVRGRVRHEKVGGRDAIIIDEIPYQVSQSALIEKIVEASKEDRIPDISDVRNHSGRDARTRIQIILKKGADAGIVEKQLYEFTPLQTSYSIQNIALVNHQPRTLSLRQLIQCYIDHRCDVIRRRCEFELRHARQAAHKLEGLIYAVCDIDEVIRLIRTSRTREEAIERLMERAFRIPASYPRIDIVPARLVERAEERFAAGNGGVRLTRVQAEAIGALRLIQLVGLEIEKLANELNGLLETIDELETILADSARILAIVRADTIALAERFGDDRLTSIESNEAEDFELGELVPQHVCVVTVSHAGYVKRLPLDTYRTQGRGGMGVKGAEQREDDYIEHVMVCGSHDDLLCFTDTGRVFRIKVWQIPEMARTAKGRAIVNLLELREGEKVKTFLPIEDFEKKEDYLVFATQRGRVKRTSLKDYRNVNRGGIIAIALNDGDNLVGVISTSGEDHVLLGTREGMAIRFDEDDARVMGRDTAGVKGIELADSDAVVGIVRCDDTRSLLTVTTNGFGKRTGFGEYLVQSEDGSTRAQSRGGKGRIDIQTNDKNGFVVAVLPIAPTDSVVVVSSSGMLVRTPAAEIREIGRNTQGVRVVRLKDGDAVVGVASAPMDEPDAASETGAPAGEADGPPPAPGEGAG